MLLRARAIENQYYVAAPAQIGETLPGKPAYGRSLIVDPWGIVLAQAPDEETVITAELDRARLREVRDKLPSLAEPPGGRVPVADARLIARRLARAVPDLVPDASRTWGLQLGEPYEPGAAGYAVRVELPDGRPAVLKVHLPAPRGRARGGRARSSGTATAPCGCSPATTEQLRAAARALRAGNAALGRRPGGRARRPRRAAAPALESGGGALRHRSRTRPSWWADYSPETWERFGRTFERQLLDAAVDALQELAAHAGRAGAPPPGPARRQRARRAARAVAGDRPEAADGRARVRGRADRPLARARPLAGRRARPPRPADLRARPRPRARSRLDDRADDGVGVRRRAYDRGHAEVARWLLEAGRDCCGLSSSTSTSRIARPGPELGPDGYARLGARFGLDLDPIALRRGAREGGRGHPPPPGARARRGDLGRLHRADHPRHGRQLRLRLRVRSRDDEGVGTRRALRALRGRAAGARASCGGHGLKHRPRLEHRPRTWTSSSPTTGSRSTPHSRSARSAAPSRTRRSSAPSSSCSTSSR